MNATESVESYLCKRRGKALSICARCLAEALNINNGEVIRAMWALKGGRRHVVRVGTCQRCEQRWLLVISTTVIARGEAIDEFQEEEQQGDNNA